jgi:mannose-6-phosphate isomerase-like protein (cupin superfamily)
MIMEGNSMEIINRYQPDTETYIEEGCYIVELHNSAADADCSIARARVAPGMTTRLHSLSGILERYVIIEGQGEVTVGNQPVRSVHVLDVVNIPAGVPQSICNTGHTDLIFLCICTPRFVVENYRDLGQ